MSDNINMTQEDIINLVKMAQNHPTQVTKLKTDYVIDKFLKNKRRSVRTLLSYKHIFQDFTSMYPELPTESTQIDAFLSTVKGSDQNVNLYYITLRALYTFASEILNYTDAMSKMHSPKLGNKEYKLRTPQELTAIFQAAKPGLETVLLLVCLDSTCRIGALGRHETLPGQWYPGINISNLAENTFTIPAEKTGERTYSCLPEIIELMLQIANPAGYIFVSKRDNQPLTSDNLSHIFTRIVKRAGVKGTKLEPHSFRHLGGSLIAKYTKSALAVKAKLGHDKIETSMKYIQDAEKEISQGISPLHLALSKDYRFTKQQQSPQQRIMITEQSAPDGNTALVPFDPTNSNETVEKVEATVDMTDQLYPEVPDDLPDIRPVLKPKDIQAIRKAFIYYSINGPQDGTTAITSSMMKHWTTRAKKSKIQPTHS